MGKEKWDKGQCNLVILGIGATIVTGITLTASLLVYRNSGDIYLDRSRPGYLPEEDEVEEVQNNTTKFVYSDSGELDKAELDQYLEVMQAIVEKLEDSAQPYTEEPLSNKSLGLPTETTPTD